MTKVSPKGTSKHVCNKKFRVIKVEEYRADFQAIGIECTRRM